MSRWDTQETTSTSKKRHILSGVFIDATNCSQARAVTACPPMSLWNDLKDRSATGQLAYRGEMSKPRAVLNGCAGRRRNCGAFIGQSLIERR